MSFELEFHRLAFRDLKGAVGRYRSQSTRAADRFIVAVDQAIQKILANPLQWPEFDRGFRWFRLRKFP